jgi:hypothetical protein
MVPVRALFDEANAVAGALRNGKWTALRRRADAKDPV